MKPEANESNGVGGRKERKDEEGQGRKEVREKEDREGGRMEGMVWLEGLCCICV